MKAPFTPFQLVLTVINLFMFICCVVGDVFILLLDSSDVNETTFKINLVLSVLAIVFSSLLTFKTGSFNIFGDAFDPQSDPMPAVTALRTYFCMIFFDLGGVLSIMFLGALLLKNARTLILIFAPLMFVVSAVVYFVRVSRMGLDDFDTDNFEEDNADENF